MDNKLTDTEIKKALEFLAKYCKDEYNGIRVDEVLLGAFDLINRQEEEKENLKAEVERLANHIQEGIDLAKQIPEMLALAKAEAYKECIDKIKVELKDIDKIECLDDDYYVLHTTFFNNLLKEMGVDGKEGET